MSRIVFVIRHGKSIGNRHNRALFGKKGAALTEEGVASAKLLKDQLAVMDINVATEPVAVSALQRTYQTASYAGFKDISVNPLLNEVQTGLGKQLDEVLERKEVPEAASKAARAILADPPKENVWVTHGLVIAALADELGISTDKVFIPEMGSITRLTLK